MNLKIKKVVICVLVLAFGLLIGCGGNGDGAGDGNDTEQVEQVEQVVLKLAHHLAIDGTHHQTLMEMQEIISQKTDGNLILELYPASQLGNQREVIEGVREGTIDMALGDHAYLSSLVPEYGVFDLPFIFRDYEHLGKVLDGPIAEEIGEKLVQQRGLRTLGWMFVGFRHVITTEKPIQSIEDFAGLKIRAPEAAVYIDTLTLLGARPTPIPWGEVYTALQTGVVEGMESAPESIYSMKFHEVAKYLTATDHIQVSISVVINEELWQSLKPEYRQAIQEAFLEVIPAQREATAQVNQESVENMVSEGIETFEIDRQVLADAVKPLWQQFGEENDAQEFVDRVIDTN